MSSQDAAAKLEAEAAEALAEAEAVEERDLANLDGGNCSIFALEDDDGIDLLDGSGAEDNSDGEVLSDLAAALTGAKVCTDSDAAKAVVKMCRVCGKNPAQKNQVFCTSPCAGDVRGATRQAKEQGPEAIKAFQALRKTNPEEFVAAIHIFRAKCASAGRGYKRPEFQWVRYHMAIILASRLQRGAKSLWLTNLRSRTTRKLPMA